MEKEIQEILNNFLEQVEEREDQLASFHDDVQRILKTAESNLEKTIAELDADFSNNIISEEEYLEKFKERKSSLLDITKKELDQLLQKTQSIE